ncbi:MAG TPA: DinB family protein, partial [Gemmatimonadaceae bacterium]|nr:DinB family protein [Gemmatimonadaceae bacterium]
MTAINRCALTYNGLLEVTSTEHHRWRDWFVEHPKAWVVPFATGRMATIGGLVLHIFGVELRYAQRLLDQEVTAWEEFRQTSIDEVFDLGDNARGQLVHFLTTAPEKELDRVLTFQTLTAGTISASKYKIASNIFLHDIRHWGQIAT